MDELKDFMDIRISTRCPLCGKRLKRLSIEINGHTPAWISCNCNCGFSMILDNTKRKVVTRDDGSKKQIDLESVAISDKDILDEWNEVSSK